MFVMTKSLRLKTEAFCLLVIRFFFSVISLNEYNDDKTLRFLEFFVV